MKSTNLARLRIEYRIFDRIGLIVPKLDERACYLKLWCVAVSDDILRTGLRLPIHPFFH